MKRFYYSEEIPSKSISTLVLNGIVTQYQILNIKTQLL